MSSAIGSRHPEPWYREVWANRPHRPLAMVVGALLFAVGFHLANYERPDWSELPLLIGITEAGLLFAYRPEAAHAPRVFAGMRRSGVLCTVVGLALVVCCMVAGFLMRPLTSPADVLLFSGMAVGALAALLGATLLYWSSPLVLRWQRNSRPANPRLVFALGVVAIAGNTLVLAFGRHADGRLATSRVIGLCLLAAGLGLALVAHLEDQRAATDA